MRELESIKGFSDVEFSVFSQFGDDGIIQWLIHRLPDLNQTFVEFGVGDYQEANTRFLLMNDNWSGLVMDSSSQYVKAIRRDPVSLNHDLQSECAIVTAENINQLLLDHGFEGDIGLLHIDIDGNDYWVWRAITAVRPAIVDHRNTTAYSEPSAQSRSPTTRSSAGADGSLLKTCRCRHRARIRLGEGTASAICTLAPRCPLSAT